MAKSPTPSIRPVKEKKKNASTKKVKRPPTPEEKARARRETVEAVVVAFLLAFLIRTFEAEAFVIPTGSMAPTLQGMHKDEACPQCGYRYRTSASSESPDEADRGGGRPRRVAVRVCPMCRFPADDAMTSPTYSGDRIVVAKFPYDYAEPQRWDVLVFKYPGDAAMNYIKRLIGLPGEELRIYRGDVYTRLEGDQPWQIARKSPQKLQAMLQTVYDSEFPAPALAKIGFPPRWSAASDWKSDELSTSFQSNGTGGAWLRYEHRLPGDAAWRAVASGRATEAARREAAAQLIGDYYEYNDFYTEPPTARYRSMAVAKHWVGDLGVQGRIEAAGAEGAVVLELVEGGCRFQCRLDAATGSAVLRIVNRDGAVVEAFAPQGETSFGAGSHTFCFVNADDQLYLWVDGKVIDFDAATTFDELGLPTQTPYSTPENRGDLSPVGIRSEGASIAVRGLKVLRDVYYIHGSHPRRRFLMDFNGDDLASESGARRTFSDPSRWDVFDDAEEANYRIGPDQYFMLGDNSPASKDGRLWAEDMISSFVDRELLIGKALFVYWPHAEYFVEIPGTGLRVPLLPNFRRMGFVR